MKVSDLIAELKLQDLDAEVAGELYVGDTRLDLRESSVEDEEQEPEKTASGKYMLDIDEIIADYAKRAEEQPDGRPGARVNFMTMLLQNTINKIEK